ncbi:hypothetical protein H0H87_002344 [Tephrocybe sp. NHM501043]|nr:hypothetical protein H0H87_002344 [Tephrocybe sp. NHM501043]
MTNIEPVKEKESYLLDNDLRKETSIRPDSEIGEKCDQAPAEPPAPNPRFHEPPPSAFKRAALIAFTLLLLWLAFAMRQSLWKSNREAKVIYASRYSKEHKFRPAASPIITETLKDGRVRIRGAAPTATPQPTPKTVPKSKRSNKKLKLRKGKAAAWRKDGKAKPRP